MSLRPLTKFDKDDVVKLRQFFTVFTHAKYELKGDGLELAGSLIAWYRGLEAKIDDAIKKQVMAELEESSPKIGPIDSAPAEPEKPKKKAKGKA